MMKFSITTLMLVMAICCPSKAQNIISATAGIIRFNASDSTSNYATNRMVRNVRRGKNGAVLIAAISDGILRYDGNSFTSLTRKIGPRRYWDVLEDRNGNLWCATVDSGIYKYDGKFFEHITTKEGLAHNAVMSVIEDKAGIIWLGTGGGISRYDGLSFKNLTSNDGLPNGDITNIIEDKSGKLWIGSRGGFCTYDGKTFTILRNEAGKAFNNVWGIIEDKNGNIWFGATIIEGKQGNRTVVTAGLWRYDGRSFLKVDN